MTRDGLDRIEKAIGSLDTRMRTIENSAMADMAVQKNRLDAAFEKIDEHKGQIEKITTTQGNHARLLEQFQLMRKGVWWLVVLVGAAVFGLLWAIFTHQVEITQVIR